MSHEMELHPSMDAVRCKKCGLTIRGEELAAWGATPATCITLARTLASIAPCTVFASPEEQKGWEDKIVAMVVEKYRSKAEPTTFTLAMQTCPGCGKENDAGVNSCWWCGGSL